MKPVAKAQDDMIRFRCHRCKKRIAAPQGHVGKKVKCPSCQIVTIVPDIPGAEQASTQSLPPRKGSGRQAPPPPAAPPAPMDDLSQLATATSDETYEVYDQGGSYQAEPERPRGPRIKRKHMQWIGALSMGLHALWVLTLAFNVWVFVEFIMLWNDAGPDMETAVIVAGFGEFFIALVFCFCCFTGAMACSIVGTMGRKMNSL